MINTDIFPYVCMDIIFVPQIPCTVRVIISSSSKITHFWSNLYIRVSHIDSLLLFIPTMLFPSLSSLLKKICPHFWSILYSTPLLFTFFFFSPPSNRENTFEKFPFHTRHVYTTDVLTSFRNHQRRAGANLTSRFVSPLVHESENADSGYTANLSLSPSLSLSLPFRIFLAAGRETYIYASSTLKLPSRLSTTSAGSFAFFPWISLAVE